MRQEPKRSVLRPQTKSWGWSDLFFVIAIVISSLFILWLTVR